jgi:hypothetical protein
LFKNGEVIPNKANMSSRRKQLEILAELLVEELGQKAKFFKILIIHDALISKLCHVVFEVFTNIETVIISGGKYYSNHLALATMLTVITNLKSVEFCSNILNQYDFIKIDEKYRLPTIVKRVKVLQKGFDELHFELLERIDSTYTELKELTIFNQRMLANLKDSTFNNLKKLEFLPHSEFNSDYVINFIQLNQDLNNLTLPYNILNSAVLEAILNLKQLTYWKISYPPDDIFQIGYLPVNSSITYLNLYSYIPGAVLIPVLNSLKSLKTLEFSNYNFEDFVSIPWHQYKSKIHTLLLNGLINCNGNVDYMVPLDKFEIIKFWNIFDLNYMLINHDFENLTNWRVLEGTKVNLKNFTLVKKGSESSFNNEVSV